MSKQQLALYAVAVLAILVVGSRYMQHASGKAPARASPAVAAPLKLHRAPARVVVHVAGAVRKPGVYRLPAWARLNVAVRRAGGPTPQGDLGAVNLAAKLADGQQVIVPARGPIAGAGGGSAGTGATGGAGAAVSLSTATLEQLDTLEGVGPVTAQKIIDWRQQHGGFSSVDDLKQISGIGPKRFESLKDKVRM
jgi:competence protein ComEA